MSRLNRHCANCGRYLLYANCSGISAIYSSRDIRLCEPCFLDEDTLINEEGNDLPEQLAHYRATISRLG